MEKIDCEQSGQPCVQQRLMGKFLVLQVLGQKCWTCDMQTLGFILWGTGMFVQTVSAIRPTVVGMSGCRSPSLLRTLQMQDWTELCRRF